ncbi:MBL fold metallo-hydrolase [uncultured Sphaerotilus sp.]|uniref:MBL fold metallo-hydrolase n=1 Tax=uncultured Sphaerotilus sp. TaxID=474984 RepID=UPI0030CA4F56
MTLPAHAEDLGHQIYAIDTGFERARFDAAYLVVDSGRAAFIDTGHNAAVPRLLDTLAALGLSRDAVDWVIPTHVHLDHAGGAGLLMTQLPQARALIHPRGARHLINPLALVEGARAVYGVEVVRQTYGTVEPIPAERVVESHDAMEILLGQRPLRLIDTPGHARHHHCIWDARSRGWFTGDTFGISYREFDTAAGPWMFPSTTPVQFDPDALRQSIDRLLESDPQVLYPTHFSRVDNVPRVAAQFREVLDQFVSGARAVQADWPADRAERVRRLEAMVASTLLASARKAGISLAEEAVLALLQMDVTLNAQGINVWLSQGTARKTEPEG